MKLAIVGSRIFTDYDYLKDKLEPIKNKVKVVVSGGAKGADTLGERWADEHNIPKEIYYPDWNKYGKKAGFLRNKIIVDKSDAVVAFQVDSSKGTQHTIELAKKENKKVKVYKVELLQSKAQSYATKRHYEVNHHYDDKPYEHHLKMVVDVAKRYIYLIPKNKREAVIAGCWVHDIIEDARETYNDVKDELGIEVAEFAYALTNEKGKTRTERANDKYYEGIRNTPFATFIKLCDRIANFEYSIEGGSRMAKVYKKENENFCEKLYKEDYKEMIDHLKHLSEKID